MSTLDFVVLSIIKVFLVKYNASSKHKTIIERLFTYEIHL